MENTHNSNISKQQFEYQNHLKELVNKSQESFEKQLSYISAGSLTISLAFIKDVVGNLKEANNEYLLIISWSCMGLTLLINLLSHVYTSKCHNKTISEIDVNNYNYEQAKCRFDNIEKINYFSIGSLIIGILFLIIFISLNI